MIEYYKIPVRKGEITQKERLHLSDDSELKDAIYNKSIEKVKILSFKNSSIKDDTLNLLAPINMPLPIIHLDLSQNFSFVTDKSVQILSRLLCLQNLKILNLADNQISDQALIFIAKSTYLHHLQELILYGNSDVSGASLIFLAESILIKQLKVLDLHATSVDDEGMNQLFQSENCSNLQKLNLNMSWQRITDKTLYSLANSKYCSKLKELLLQDCKITDKGIDVLSQSENSGSLERLSINNSIKQKNNLITDKSLTSLALSKYLINLKILQLRNSEITPKGLKTIAVSLAVQRLQELRISHCSKIDEEVLVYIQKIVGYQSLKKVYLNDCKIDLEQIKAFEHKNPQINLIF